MIFLKIELWLLQLVLWSIVTMFYVQSEVEVQLKCCAYKYPGLTAKYFEILFFFPPFISLSIFVRIN